MFPETIYEILKKYSDINKSEITHINENVKNIIKEIKSIRSNLSKEVTRLIEEDDIDDKEDEVLSDIKALKDFINSIPSFDAVLKDSDSHTEITPDFTNKVYVYLMGDDICPFCNVKFDEHLIHYQRIKDNSIHEESITWYRCPNCKKMFVIDYDLEGFNIENTNIVINKSKYTEFPHVSSIDVYSAIVLSNTLKCSVNHGTIDITAKIPVIKEDGSLDYCKLPASYCYDCKRFTILKDDFNKIKDVVMCKVTDLTTEYSTLNDDNIELVQRNSILFSYGYNVQSKTNLSDDQRHTILSIVIEANIMNRSSIINHLNTLIDRGSKIPSWKSATQKWKQDKEFVSNYNNDYLPEYIFDEIILKYNKG